jgi:hypothetical protein
MINFLEGGNRGLRARRNGLKRSYGDLNPDQRGGFGECRGIVDSVDVNRVECDWIAVIISIKKMIGERRLVAFERYQP